jgi:hypothetical protein
VEQITLETGGAPDITITVIGGDLRLNGWEQNRLQAEAGRSDELQAESTQAGVTLACRSDCVVWVPYKAHVRVQEVKGDLTAKALEGALEVQAVQGCLLARQVGAVSAERVAADVNVKRVEGALKLGSVGGSVLVRGVTGDLEASAVGGDLHVIQAAGSIKSHSGGDSDLRVAFAPGRDYALDANGDMHLRAFRGSAARLEIEAGGDISTDVAGAQVEGGPRRKVVTLGQGEAGQSLPPTVKVRAGGDVSLSGSGSSANLGELGEDLGRLADEYAAQIEDQIHSHLADFEHWTEQFAHGSMPADAVNARADELAAQMREAMDRIGDKARRKAEAARRKMERQAEHGYRRHTWSWRSDAPARPASPNAPPPEPVSDAERLAVLHMLEQGKISVAEAEKLLAALEGRA